MIGRRTGCATISLAERWLCTGPLLSSKYSTAKGGARGPWIEFREDGETSPRAGEFRRANDGDADGRNNNRGGRDGGIVMEALAKNGVRAAGYERQRTL